jgi:hypothetical protein
VKSLGFGSLLGETTLGKRLERLRDAVEAEQRRARMFVVILDLPETPTWAMALADGRCVRVVGGHADERLVAIAALASGQTPSGTTVMEFRRGASEAIRLAVDPETPPEVAVFGARGDGKSWCQLAAVIVFADLHREAGIPVPVRGLALTDFLRSHKLRLIRTAERPEWGGVWSVHDDGHLLVLTIDGVEYARIDLVGVEDLGALDRLRMETCILLGDELAPAGVMESSAGVTVDAWSIARTSQRIASYKRPAIAAMNLPDLDHWTWRRWVTTKQAGTAYVRIRPGERASEEQREEWAKALEGRPDLVRRLLEGEPGVIAEGPQVALGYRSDLHVSRGRLRVVPNVPIVCGMTPGSRR